MSATDHVRRIERLLSAADVASLLYAALELRMGTEARQAQYAAHWDHVPSKVKKTWNVAEQERGLASAFRFHEQVVHFTHLLEDGTPIVKHRYVPVSRRLVHICELVGAYLHSRGWQRKYDQSREHAQQWIDDLYQLVVEGYAHLSLAVAGTMLGPPYIDLGANTVAVRGLVSAEARDAVAPYMKSGASLRIDFQLEDLDGLVEAAHRSALEAFPWPV